MLVFLADSQFSEVKKNKNQGVRVVLLVSTLLCLCLILVGINRGFDVTDEGLYLLLINPVQENEGAFFNYDLFFKLIYQISSIDFGIIGSRLIRLISYSLGAFFCALFWKNIHEQEDFNWDVFMVSLLAIFGGYSFLPPSLSYNSLSVVLACIWLYCTSIKGEKLQKYICLGIVLALMAYVKITACISLSFLTILILLWRKELKLKGILFLVLPVPILELVFYFFLGESLLTRINTSLSIIQGRPDYDWYLLLKHNLVGIFWFSMVFLPGFILSKWIKINFKAKFFLLAVIVIIVFYFTKITAEWTHLVMLISAAFLSYVLGQIQWTKISSLHKQLILVLICIPFALHLGSNVYWMRLAIHYWLFWVLAILLVWPHFKEVTLGFSSTLATVAFILVFAGRWFQPFEGIPLWESNTKWEYRQGKNIYLSKEMVDVLRDLKEKTNVIPEGELIAVYRNAGWLVLLNRTSPFNPGIWDKEQLIFHFSKFPKGVEGIIYFPYQELPKLNLADYLVNRYQLKQGEMNLLVKKQ
ncbi:hypothetical protein ALPR1_09420 [Algoriphagus machipongonensis]|uniref:Glycosyltransferase RgtA/B/C/D-like domain-containing protein n=1 Tax=Algoriphagus machipongonensis TaxID=388413 RepID=A3HRF5_9BACT|nr:hypothetical protein ALPR1_09420 [Algoriphagus machipongonensis]